MQQIGRQLKEAREQQGISLAMVQERTKVSLRYLQAIEAGAFHLIPGEVYLRGFIRSYSRVVGVDANTLLQAYDEQNAKVVCCEPVATGSLLTRLAHGVRHNVFRSMQRFN